MPDDMQHLRLFQPAAPREAREYERLERRRV